MIYSGHYMLTIKDIEKILKEGKFDKKKYSNNLLCHAVTVQEVFERYWLDDEVESIELEDWEKEEIKEDITGLGVCSTIEYDLDDDIDERMKEYMEKYIRGRENRYNRTLF